MQNIFVEFSCLLPQINFVEEGRFKTLKLAVRSVLRSDSAFFIARGGVRKKAVRA